MHTSQVISWVSPVACGFGPKLSTTSGRWASGLGRYPQNHSWLVPDDINWNHFCAWPRSMLRLWTQHLMQPCIQTCALGGWCQACGGTSWEKFPQSRDSQLHMAYIINIYERYPVGQEIDKSYMLLTYNLHNATSPQYIIGCPHDDDGLKSPASRLFAQPFIQAQI